VTPAELDALAAIQASVRARYQIARNRAAVWLPAPPPPSGRKAAADVDGGGE